MDIQLKKTSSINIDLYNKVYKSTSEGGADIDVVQTTGTSKTSVMSQKATTDELHKIIPTFVSIINKEVYLTDKNIDNLPIISVHFVLKATNQTTGISHYNVFVCKTIVGYHIDWDNSDQYNIQLSNGTFRAITNRLFQQSETKETYLYRDNGFRPIPKVVDDMGDSTEDAASQNLVRTVHQMSVVDVRLTDDNSTMEVINGDGTLPHSIDMSPFLNYNLAQATGTNENSVMSQKAITEALSAKEDSIEVVYKEYTDGEEIYLYNPGSVPSRFIITTPLNGGEFHFQVGPPFPYTELDFMIGETVPTFYFYEETYNFNWVRIPEFKPNTRNLMIFDYTGIVGNKSNPIAMWAEISLSE